MKESCDTIARATIPRGITRLSPLAGGLRGPYLLIIYAWMQEEPRSESVNTDMKEEPCVPDHDMGTADASSQKGDGARKMAVKIMDEELVKLHPDDIHVPTTGTASAFVDSPTCLGSPGSFLTWIEFKCIKSYKALLKPFT
uniref:Uncharacterized protein orf140 n=2 Tax=Beta TaxID=3554 RepID=E6ZDX6_BETVM|nr:hypothetical protein LKY74_mgp117 [Beta vulgaris subsp. maritima]YP_004842200.1 hypothetical protein LKY79_mgp005 [Beta macrocarpa]CBJ23348.1 hypothetical protein [Beta vulgaris subsp. maritima]CBL52037.1 hypothetical protein [Beta vulgaris subsp. maritima]CBX25005.1 hypothetical protein [Beta macrocarpa]CBX33242.1 hypothetical protein [Beta vulgaris subsp. maritima]CBX33296.1 hypothetical protein [Beta vulgaris subsp. maritima]